VTRLHLAFFTAINVLNYLDRYLVAAVLPLIMAGMSLSNEEGGRLVSAFVFGYFLFSPVFGYLGDRWHRPMLMCIGIVGWSLATIATGFAQTFLWFFLIRMAVGVGEASFSTIAPGYLRDRVNDPVRLNSVLSIFFAAIPVGSALGYVVGGHLGQHYSWQTAFFVGGLPGLLLGVLLLRFREVRRTAAIGEPVLAGLRAIGRSRVLVLAILGYVLNSFALNGVAAFVSKHGLTLGFDLAGINASFGQILVLAGVIGTVGGGRLASRLAAGTPDPTRVLFRFLGVTGLLATPFLLGAFLVEDRAAFLWLCFAAEVLIFAGTAPVNSIIVSAAPEGAVTLTQGVTIFALNLFGALLAPILVGALADATSLQAALQGLALPLGLSGLVWYLGGLKPPARA